MRDGNNSWSSGLDGGAHGLDGGWSGGLSATSLARSATGTTAGAAGSTAVLTGGANFIVLGVAAHEKRVLGKWCWWLMLAVFCLFSPLTGSGSW